ncbi:hypothetical protein KJZ61_00505 [Candidatus Dependentiae bacterium]|nr:hypothetical protein [Candidatus Dependentiae bacterium]
MNSIKTNAVLAASTYIPLAQDLKSKIGNMNLRIRIAITLFKYCVLSALLTLNVVVRADGGSFIYDDGPSIDIPFDPEECLGFLSEGGSPLTRNATPESVIDIIKTVGGIELLQQDFFLETYPLNRRNVLDLPAFIKGLNYYYPRYVFGAHAFYDQMTKSYFTHNSTNIGSYIGMNQETVIEALHSLLSKVKILFPSFEFPFIDLFDLFANAKVQERRFGIMFHMMRKYKGNIFLCYLPFYYFERNYFLTEEEQDRITALLASTSPEDEADFQKKHLICDKLGFGDMRFIIAYPALRNPDYEIDLGAQITLPTSCALVKGLLGSTYKDKNTSQPTFSFTEVLDLGSVVETRQEAADKATEFFLASLDRLSAILLDTSLGNNGHLGIGIIANTKTRLSAFVYRPWAQAVVFKSKIAAEYLLPKTRRRYFVEKDNAKRFDDHNFNDESKATENLAFLEQQFVDKFFPYVLETRIHPGFVFVWTTKAIYATRYGEFHLGSDTWLKTPDHLGVINASPLLADRLDRKKAKGIWGYQSTVFGSIAFKNPKKNKDLIVEFNVASTIATRGIGGQFTIGLLVEKNF